VTMFGTVSCRFNRQRRLAGEIRWRWTADGRYSSKSAYEMQFRGTYCTFNTKAIWWVKAEEKHRLFVWLLVQNKILTVDRLQVRNWSCDPICRLCDQEPETAQRLCLHCVYAQEVWHLVSGWSKAGGIWLSVEDRRWKHARLLAALLIYTCWNLWKERNRRVFEGVSQPPARILALIKDEVQVRRSACGEDGGFVCCLMLYQPLRDEFFSCYYVITTM
jgi:hypothetical protein